MGIVQFRSVFILERKIHAQVFFISNGYIVICILEKSVYELLKMDPTIDIFTLWSDKTAHNLEWDKSETEKILDKTFPKQDTT